MNMNAPSVIPLAIVAFIVCFVIIPAVSFVFGRHVGRNCECCGYAKVCYPCDRYCRPGSEKHVSR